MTQVSEAPAGVPAPAKARVRLPESYSSFIHLLRVVATIAVFVGHVTKPDMLFDVDIAILGRATIPIFFMMSGFLTAMTFEAGGVFWKGVLRRYANMYFIFLPAALLIFAMDMVIVAQGGALVANDKFDSAMSLGRGLVEFLEVITFSGEYWSLSPVGQGLFSNQAMWTMDYIMAYTVMTSAFYLLDGWRRIAALLLAALIAGPTVLLLSPLWIAGVAAFEATKPDGAGKRYLPNMVTLPRVPLVATTVIVCVGTVIWVEKFGLGQNLYAFSKDLASYEVRQYLGMAKRFAWQYAYLPALFLLMVAARQVLTGPMWSKKAAKGVKMASRYCLPVYALHFTAIYFVEALIPDYMGDRGSSDPYLLALSSLAICVVFGWLCFTYLKPVSDRLVNRYLA